MSGTDPYKVDVLAVAADAPRTDLIIDTSAAAEEVRALLEQCFPGRIGDDVGTLTLREALRPRPDTAYAGVFGDTVVLCGQELVQLADLTSLVDAVPGAGTLIRVQVDGVMRSVALDVIAPGGVLVRELLVIGDEGVVADEGDRLDAELPFWPDGSTENSDDLVPFEIADFGDALLAALFGVSRQAPADTQRDPGSRALVGFTVLPDPQLAVPDPSADADLPESTVETTGATARPLPTVTEPTERDPLGLGGGAVGRVVVPPSDVPEAAPGEHRSWWQRLLGGS